MKDWLLSELRSVVSPSEAARFALDLSNQTVALVERRMSGTRERASVAYGAPDFDDQIALMRRIAGRGRSSDVSVDILLPQELVLGRVELFPAEARGALRDEAWWRLDKMTPYRPEKLCYDVALLGSEPKTGFLEVNVVVAPRDIVAEAISYAKSWGFAPQRITAAPEEGFPDGPLLLQASNARLETQSLRRSALWLGVAASLFLALGAWRGVAARQAVADEIEARQARAEAALAEVETVRTATLAFAESALRPFERRRDSRTSLEWLDAIAEALPSGSVAERIVMADGVVRVEGATGAPEGVLSAFESAPAFDATRHADALRPIAGASGRWRFAIEARLTPHAPDV